MGFFERADEGGDAQYGLAVYVPGNRMVTEEDFSALLPAFCESHLDDLLRFAMRIEGAPDVSFLMLQIEFYGPKIGENQTYIAGAETVDLDDGECSF